MKIAKNWIVVSILISLAIIGTLIVGVYISNTPETASTSVVSKSIKDFSNAIIFDYNSNYIITNYDAIFSTMEPNSEAQRKLQLLLENYNMYNVNDFKVSLFTNTFTPKFEVVSTVSDHILAHTVYYEPYQDVNYYVKIFYNKESNYIIDYEVTKLATL